jgi:hypothetical protein
VTPGANVARVSGTPFGVRRLDTALAFFLFDFLSSLECGGSMPL